MERDKQKKKHGDFIEVSSNNTRIAMEQDFHAVAPILSKDSIENEDFDGENEEFDFNLIRYKLRIWRFCAKLRTKLARFFPILCAGGKNFDFVASKRQVDGESREVSECKEVEDTRDF